MESVNSCLESKSGHISSFDGSSSSFQYYNKFKKVYVLLLEFEIFLEDTNLYLLSFTKQAFHISYSKYMYSFLLLLSSPNPYDPKDDKDYSRIYDVFAVLSVLTFFLILLYLII